MSDESLPQPTAPLPPLDDEEEENDEEEFISQHDKIQNILAKTN